MITLCILIILLLTVVFIAIGIVGGVLALFIDPIICILIIYLIIKLVNYFRDIFKR
jgi:hypothetical protein